MCPVQQFATTTLGSIARNAHEKSGDKSHKTSAFRKLASKTIDLLHLAHSREDAFEAKSKDQTANVEAAIRQAQSKCGDLVDAILTMREHDEATVESRSKLKERIEQYRFRIGRLWTYIQGEIGLIASCKDMKSAAVVRKQLKQSKRELSWLENLLRREIAEQRKRRVELQLRYKNLREAQEMAERLTAFVNAKFLPRAEQHSDAAVPQTEHDREHAEPNDVTDGTCQEPGAGLAQQQLTDSLLTHTPTVRLTAWTKRRARILTEPERQQQAVTTATAVANDLSIDHRTDAAKPRKAASEQCKIPRKPVPKDHARLQTPSPKDPARLHTPLPENERPQRAATIAATVAANNDSLNHRADAMNPRKGASEQLANLRKPWTQDPARLYSPLPKKSGPDDDPSHDEVAVADLRQEYWDARIRLFVAQRDFDNRDEKRESEREKNNRRLQGSGSKEAMPRTELDLRWMKHISKLTRKLINTEEAFKNAKVAALDGGYVPSDSSVSSVFNDGSDGYSPSFEDEMKATAPKDMIEDWRQAIPEDSEIGAESGDHIRWPEIGAAESEDHIPWEGRQPEVWWESSSAVAEPRHHIKIQAWWKSCVAADKGPE
jgi:hypothetical protein